MNARIEPLQRTHEMSYSIANGGSHYALGSLRELMAKASPARSGDFLAEIAADSAGERALAPACLAEVPLTRFLEGSPEHNEVTRLILEQHDPDTM
jgi:ethanolamine ammonia-lyase large subunit